MNSNAQIVSFKRFRLWLLAGYWTKLNEKAQPNTYSLARNRYGYPEFRLSVGRHMFLLQWGR